MVLYVEWWVPSNILRCRSNTLVVTRLMHLFFHFGHSIESERLLHPFSYGYHSRFSIAGYSPRRSTLILIGMLHKLWIVLMHIIPNAASTKMSSLAVRHRYTGPKPSDLWYNVPSILLCKISLIITDKSSNLSRCRSHIVNWPLAWLAGRHMEHTNRSKRSALRIQTF